MKQLMIGLLFLLGFDAAAQTIKGSVTDAVSREGLPGATLRWLSSGKGAGSDAAGQFEIAYPAQLPDRLVVSYTGYTNDTIEFNNQEVLHVRLKATAALSEVQVTGMKEAMSHSLISTVNRQTLGMKELQKAACCNLAESFETNATVDVTYSDALTGSRQVKMLGLDGAYTQTLLELMPGIRGLSSGLGYAHLPGSWIQSIDITKGAGSVVNGYESIAGQINLDLLKPEKADPLLVNLYAGDLGRYEANVLAAHRFSKKWSTLLLTHASTVAQKNDFNGDGFADVPTGYQLSAMNRWKYENPGRLLASFGVLANTDQRTGGQMSYSNRGQNDAGQVYGIGINSRHAEGFGKVFFGFAGRPYKGIGVTATARSYEQDAFYGPKRYNGKEQTLYGNLVYQTIIGSSEHKLKAGLSYMLDHYRERYNDSAFGRTESVPGVFAEYNYDDLKYVSLVLGMRADQHNLYGLLLNPRAHAKVNLGKASALRFSAGRGVHVANIFIENAATLASARQVIVQEQLKPEIAWNYGISFTHKRRLLNRNTTLVLDYYRTDFENQVIADLDYSAQQIRFYNLAGRSYANSMQAELIIEPAKRMEVRAAYKYQDVRSTYHGELLQKPLIAQDRALFNASYATPFDKWKFDATAKWFGRNRIPNTAANPDGLRMAQYSNPYWTFNAQATRAFKHVEVYAGAENIFDYVQPTQIIDAANPFGAYFDASLIWGPVMGRVLYAGLRWHIK